jgi:glucosamine 6-phosphate synthetase-like amidotransferase/phosphosugar isomerase protein
MKEFNESIKKISKAIKKVRELGEAAKECSDNMKKIGVINPSPNPNGGIYEEYRKLDGFWSIIHNQMSEYSLLEKDLNEIEKGFITHLTITTIYERNELVLKYKELDNSFDKLIKYIDYIQKYGLSMDYQALIL